MGMLPANGPFGKINSDRLLATDGKKVVGYGASTKGNVLLQFCGVTTAELPAIAEVNPDKFGAFTPGTGIPIVSEAEAHAMKPDYFLVLPWHFKEGIVQREAEFLASGGRMIFPFPEIVDYLRCFMLPPTLGEKSEFEPYDRDRLERPYRLSEPIVSFAQLPRRSKHMHWN